MGGGGCTSGVPQGFVLAPIFFSNLFKWLTRRNKNYMNMFTDDAKILCKLMMKTTKFLQEDLDTLEHIMIDGWWNLM